MSDAGATFLARFRRFGAEPSRDTYLALFHPDATLLDAGMPAPLTVADIPAHIEAVLAVAQGFRMVPERWRQGGATLFVEADNEATIAGAACRWRSLYVMELDGDVVRRGQRYYDRAPLYAALDASLPLPPPLAGAAPLGSVAPAAIAARPQPLEALLRARTAAWRERDAAALAAPWREDGALCVPGLSRALAGAEIATFHTRLLAALGELRVALRVWGGDDTLAFAAWRAEAGARTFDFAERFDLVDGNVLSGRAYLDRLALADLDAGLGA